jgi:transposase
MSSITHHRNKKTGAVYAYKVESYWDKKKKAPRNKQTCLGRVDPETGEIIPSKRNRKVIERASVAVGVTASSRVAGPHLLFEQISRKFQLDKLFANCFGEDAKLIQSLVYFIAQKGVPLSRAQSWSSACLHPFDDPIASQRVSDLLRRLSEDARQHFLSLWLEQTLEKECLFYDITSVSSYSRSNEYARYGYNRDGDSLEQINLAMLFGQSNNLPVYYRRMPGNISDVATLKTTMKSLDYLGADCMHLVLDRGFYSSSNIDELYRRNHKFTIAAPIGRKWVEKIIDKHYESIAAPQNYLTVNHDEALYTATELYRWRGNNHRLYLHIYYNAEQAASSFDAFTRKLLALKTELETGKTIKKHEELYERYFNIKETPKRGRKIEFNDTAIQKHRKRYSGFFCIISNKIKSSEEALRVYRAKDAVENCFDDLKNHLDMKRLRVHSASAMDSRLFIQFLALIYVSAIRNTTRNNDKLKYLTVRETIEEMETLTQIKYSNRYGQVFTETTPLQREIMNAFDVKLPS